MIELGRPKADRGILEFVHRTFHPADFVIRTAAFVGLIRLWLNAWRRWFGIIETVDPTDQRRWMICQKAPIGLRFPIDPVSNWTLVRTPMLFDHEITSSFHRAA